MEARPTTSMKKGWLCRTSCDEKNEEIAPFEAVMMMMIQWWSSFVDDPVMIQTWWWSSDAPDQVMIQTWWRWLDNEDDLTMKMTSRWRWLEDEYDLMMIQMIQRRRLVLINCVENTFLVKRECCCICNFRMYYLVYLMYCTPMFIPRSICNVIESFHTPMFLLGESIM